MQLLLLRHIWNRAPFTEQGPLLSPDFCFVWFFFFFFFECHSFCWNLFCTVQYRFTEISATSEQPLRSAGTSQSRPGFRDREGLRGFGPRTGAAAERSHGASPGPGGLGTPELPRLLSVGPGRTEPSGTERALSRCR